MISSLGLVVAVAEGGRVHPVGEVDVLAAADREAGDQPAAADDVQHRELFGHPHAAGCRARCELPRTMMAASRTRRATVAAMMFGEGIMP